MGIAVLCQPGPAQFSCLGPPNQFIVKLRIERYREQGTLTYVRDFYLLVILEGIVTGFQSNDKSSWMHAKYVPVHWREGIGFRDGNCYPILRLFRGSDL